MKLKVINSSIFCNNAKKNQDTDKYKDIKEIYNDLLS